MISFLITLFFVGFFLNLLYELLHSVLYKTCRDADLKEYIYLMLKGAIFDGLAIAIIYGATFFIFPAYYQLVAFIIISILFAYSFEIHSLKKGKWEYSPSMPKIFGAGITPLIQLALTGLASIYIVTTFFV